MPGQPQPPEGPRGTGWGHRGSRPYLPVLVVNHNVVRLDVAVHDAHAVAVIQRLRTQQRRHRGAGAGGSAKDRPQGCAAAGPAPVTPGSASTNAAPGGPPGPVPVTVMDGAGTRRPGDPGEAGGSGRLPKGAVASSPSAFAAALRRHRPRSLPAPRCRRRDLGPSRALPGVLVVALCSGGVSRGLTFRISYM